MDDYFNSDEYLPVCKNCGQSEFKRERDYFERDYVVLEADGSVYVDSSDMEGPISEWKYSCYHCGLEADDLEDLLAYNESDRYCGCGEYDSCNC